MTAKYCLRHLKTTRWQSSDTFIKIPKNQKMSEKFGSSRHFQHPPPRNLPRDPPALVAPGRRSTAGAVPGSGPRRLLAAPGPRRPGRPSPSAARRRPNWRPPWCFLCGQKDKERWCDGGFKMGKMGEKSWKHEERHGSKVGGVMGTLSYIHLICLIRLQQDLTWVTWNSQQTMGWSNRSALIRG